MDSQDGSLKSSGPGPDTQWSAVHGSSGPRFSLVQSSAASRSESDRKTCHLSSYPYKRTKSETVEQGGTPEIHSNFSDKLRTTINSYSASLAVKPLMLLNVKNPWSAM